MRKMKLLLVSLFISFGSIYGQQSIPLGDYRFFNPEDTLCFPPLPWMWVLVQTTCDLNCEIPTNIETIIQVTEHCLETTPEYFSGYSAREDIKNITLPNLYTYKDKMAVVIGDNYSFIHMKGCGINDYVITNTFGTLPCNSRFMIGGEPMEYYNFRKRFIEGRFFDKDNLPIVGHEYIRISEEFTSEKEKLDNNEMKDYPHDYYMYEDKKVPIYQFLEYRKEDRLYQFCDKKPLESSLSYYKELEELAENICCKYDLSRIIFMSLNYLE